MVRTVVFSIFDVTRSTYKTRPFFHLLFYKLFQAIGFNFCYSPKVEGKTTTFDAECMKHIKELMIFKNKNGHVNLPPDHELYHWTERVRDMKNRDCLHEGYLDTLNRMGFEWLDFESGFHKFALAHRSGETAFGENHPCHKWCE